MAKDKVHKIGSTFAAQAGITEAADSNNAPGSAHRRVMLITPDGDEEAAGLLATIDLSNMVCSRHLGITQWREMRDALIYPPVILYHFTDSSPESLKDFDRLLADRDEGQFQLILVAPFQHWDTLGAGGEDSADFLIAPNDDAELCLALGEAASRIDSLVLEDDRQQIMELRRLSADVERIARTLSQMTLEDEAVVSPKSFVKNPGTIADPGDDYRPNAPLEALGRSGKHATQPLSATFVRDVIKARRLRDSYFDGQLFADPAWDMLLDLLAAGLEEKQVSVSSLCIAANVPPTTALRWIKTMTDHGIFQRRADAEDGRRVWIELSEAASDKLAAYFTRLQQLGITAI